jgi:hypothetical protein
MTKILWDQTGERRYETGVDHGVLYLADNGVYDEGYGWNGLTTVTEAPSGAEASAQYADNLKYLNLISVEEFGGTIEAFTYPDEWGQCDGTAEPQPGVRIAQQSRRSFGLSYRTKVGNDVTPDLGYKLHLVYGATASPAEKAYATINDSPEALAFSWDFTTIPVPIAGLAARRARDRPRGIACQPACHRGVFSGVLAKGGNYSRPPHGLTTEIGLTT